MVLRKIVIGTYLGIEPQTSFSKAGGATTWATEAL